MTNNIKAKGDELVAKLYHEIWGINNAAKKIYARNCAIIAVKEIIKASEVFAFDPEIYNGQNPMTNYWNEVLNYLKSKQ